MATPIDLIQSYPTASIILLGIAVSFFISLVQHLILDKQKMRELKEKQKSLQEQMKLHKDKPEKMMELQKELMAHSMEFMKHSFKPMLITFIPIILLFRHMRNIFVETSLGGHWIWYYIGAAILSSLVFRKVFKLP